MGRCWWGVGRWGQEGGGGGVGRWGGGKYIVGGVGRYEWGGRYVGGG